MTLAGSVRVELLGDESKLVKAIRRAQAALNRLPDSAERSVAKLGQLEVKFERAAEAAQKFQRVSQSMVRVGMGMTAIGAAGALAAIGVAKVGASFEAVMTEAAAISGGREGFTGAFDAMSSSARKLAATTKFTGDEIGGAFKFLSMAGQDATTAIASMPHVLKLSAASGMELGRSADVVTNIMANYGLEAADMGRANNALVGAFTSSNVSLEQLGDSFRTAGSMAKNAGVPMEEMAAIFGALGNTGIQGADAGQGMKMALINLIAPSEAATAAQKELGISSKMLADEGFTAVVKQLELQQQAMHAAGKDMDFLGLVAEAFGTRAGPRMASLIGQGSAKIEELGEAIKQAQKGDLASFIEEKQLSNFTGAMTLLKSAIWAVSESLSEALLPALRPLVKAATWAASTFAGMHPVLKTIASVAFVAATGLMVLVGAVGAALTVVGLAIPALTALASLMGTTLSGLAGVAAAKMLILGVVIAKVALLAAVFVAAFKLTTAVLNLFGMGLKDNVSVAGVFADAFEMLTSSARGFATVMLNVLMAVVETMLTGFKLLGKVIPSVGRAVEAAMNAMHDAGERLVASMTDEEKAQEKTSVAAKKKAGLATDLSGLLEEMGVSGEKAGGKISSAAQEAADSLREFYELTQRIRGEGERLQITADVRPVFDVSAKFGEDITAMTKAAFEAERLVPKIDEKKFAKDMADAMATGTIEGAIKMKALQKGNASAVGRRAAIIQANNDIQTEVAEAQTIRVESFLVELRESLEKVPFQAFAASLDLAKENLIGWLDDAELARFVSTVKAPESPGAKTIRDIQADREKVQTGTLTAGLEGPFAQLAQQSMMLTSELGVLGADLRKLGATEQEVTAALREREGLHEDQIAASVAVELAALAAQTTELQLSMQPAGKASNEYARAVARAESEINKHAEALAIAGGTSQQAAALESGARRRAAAEIVAAFNSNAMSVDQHRVELLKAQAALAGLGDAGNEAAEALSRTAQPEDMSGLLSGRVGQIVDSIAQSLGISVGESDRGSIVSTISDAIAQLLEGGELDFTAIGDAIGRLIGATEGGGNFLSDLFGAGGDALSGGAADLGGAAGDLSGAASMVGDLAGGASAVASGAGGAGASSAASAAGVAAGGVAGGAGGAAGVGAGAGAAGAGAAAGGSVGTFGGPAGAAAGAAIGLAVGAVIAKVAPMVIEAMQQVASMIMSAASAIPNALDGAVKKLASFTGESRLEDALSAMNIPLLGTAVVLAAFAGVAAVVLLPVIIMLAAELIGAVIAGGALTAVLIIMLPLFISIGLILLAVGIVLGTVMAALVLLGSVASSVIIGLTALAVAIILFATGIGPLLISLGVAIAIALFPVIVVVAALVAIFALAVASIAAGAGLFALAMKTDSFERFKSAFEGSIDRIVEALEPFFANLMWGAGLFDSLLSVVMPMANAFANNEVASRMLFEAFKFVAIIIGVAILAIGFFVSAILAGVFAVATALAGFADGVASLPLVIENALRAGLAGALEGLASVLENIPGFGDAAENMVDTADDLRDGIESVPATQLGSALRTIADGAVAMSPDMHEMMSALHELTGLTWEQAQADGERLAKEKEATASLTNVPQGFKVATARFRSIIAEDMGSGSAAQQDGGQGGTNFFVDLIQVSVADAKTLIAETAEETLRRGALQTGVYSWNDGQDNGQGR